MKITSPGFYKTRNGQKAEVKYCDKYFAFGYVGAQEVIWDSQAGYPKIIFGNGLFIDSPWSEPKTVNKDGWLWLRADGTANFYSESPREFYKGDPSREFIGAKRVNVTVVEGVWE